jgi:hypothetical protein
MRNKTKQKTPIPTPRRESKMINMGYAFWTKKGRNKGKPGVEPRGPLHSTPLTLPALDAKGVGGWV